ncbi:hypothetical protein D3C81_511120 [compost metagenome]
MELMNINFKTLEDNLSEYPIIISKLKEFAEIILVLDILTNNETISINSAQMGVTICRSSMAFRIIKNKKRFLVINFVNFRDWERILPIGAKNHFRIKGTSYDHSFSFNSEEDLSSFLDKYVFSSKGLSCMFRK